MLQRTWLCEHRGGRARAFVMRDPILTNLRNANGIRNLRRMGLQKHVSSGFAKVDSKYANEQYQHAWPLLSHDELGNSNQSADTKNIMYSMYMPKRNKGLAPWFRGADTYSVKYCEQGRYEYQRYLMINRFPSEYKKHFMQFLHNIRSASNRHVTIPQEALHWLMRMIVDNFNPQHVHYIAAMKTLQEAKELDMARDVWKIMERQQTWPDTNTICAYLDICTDACEKTWAMEAWNRYCTELHFLQHGEVDPKPITRVPFSLTREELLYLPKWKKHFDHDPNLDVPDLNRFNRTREVYLRMAKIMLADGDNDLFRFFYDKLRNAMLTCPTPIPEPPNPHLIQRPRWAPYEALPSIHVSPWRVQDNGKVMALGPSETIEDEMQSRFFSNYQFLIHSIKEFLCVCVKRHERLFPNNCKIDYSRNETENDDDNNNSDNSNSDNNSTSNQNTYNFFEQVPEVALQTLSFCDSLVNELFDMLENNKLVNLNTSSLLTSILCVYRVIGKENGAQLHARANSFLERKAKQTNNDKLKENLSATNYLQILTGFADESAFYFDRVHNNYTYRDGFDPRATMSNLISVLQEIAHNTHVSWAADMHLQVVRTLVNCGTMKANEYFITNVLRSYKWNSTFLESLYQEYRKHENVDMWAELTKRALVWTARYDVAASEPLRRMIEDDYDLIKVQTRTFRELAVFQFRDVEEKRHARNVVNELPNPWIDYVSHALPFPDRDAGYPDEYGDIGQWRAPGGPGSPVKGPGYYSPPLDGEHFKGYTAEWRDLKNPAKPPEFPVPWERKYKQYARGSHPSYDMVYAGPMPEIFPGRYNFRKPTRWDFYNIEKQNKYKVSGPY